MYLPLHMIGGAGYLFYSHDEIKEKLNKVHELAQECLNITTTDEQQKAYVLIDSYHSATIEGARTTISEVKNAIDKKNPTKSEKMILNVIKAIPVALNAPVNMETLDKVWKIVVDGVCENQSAGCDGVRIGMVHIGNDYEIVHIPEVPELIEERMTELFEFIDDYEFDIVLKSVIFHFYFEYIHPYCDGNGRVGRMYSQCLLAKDKYGYFMSVPISKVINTKLGDYYNVLRECEESVSEHINITSFIEYMLEVYIKALKQYKLITTPLSEDESKIMSIMLKKNKGTISVNKAVNILSCTSQYALKVLNGLVNKGYLQYIEGEFRLGWRDYHI